jgi:ParB-like chromosome segregation protein Spo0J
MSNLNIVYVPISEIKLPEYKTRKHSKKQMEELTESVSRFGIVDPLIVNSASERKNILIGGL